MAGRHPEDASLAQLIGELSMGSREFTQLWAGNDVRPCGLITLGLRHPSVGTLTVTQQSLTRSESGDQTLIVATASGDASRAALRMLSRLAGVEAVTPVVFEAVN